MVFIQAEIFSCKGKSGRTIFTDDKNKCQEDVSSIEIKSKEKAYNQIPDLMQTIKSANFANGGRQFCGPVAVSNSLVWLEGKKNQQYQIELVHKLSSAEYMNTNPNNGNGSTGLLRGVDK